MWHLASVYHISRISDIPIVLNFSLGVYTKIILNYSLTLLPQPSIEHVSYIHAEYLAPIQIHHDGILQFIFPGQYLRYETYEYSFGFHFMCSKAEPASSWTLHIFGAGHKTQAAWVIG